MKLVKGITKEYRFELRDENGKTILDPEDIKIIIRKRPRTAPVMEKTLSGGDITWNSSDKSWYFSITEADLSAVELGHYGFVCVLIANGEEKTIYRSEADVVELYTEPADDEYYPNKNDQFAIYQAVPEGAGGGSESKGNIVGNVDETTTAFPTERPDGTPLENWDYVKVAPGATLPFTIDDITFTSPKDQAVWLGGDWIPNVSPYQNTDETPVKDKTVESYTGTAQRQSEINEENAEALKNVAVAKVEISTETGTFTDEQFNILTASTNNYIALITPSTTTTRKKFYFATVHNHHLYYTYVSDNADGTADIKTIDVDMGTKGYTTRTVSAGSAKIYIDYKDDEDDYTEEEIDALYNHSEDVVIKYVHEVYGITLNYEAGFVADTEDGDEEFKLFSSGLSGYGFFAFTFDFKNTGGTVTLDSVHKENVNYILQEDGITDYAQLYVKEANGHNAMENTTNAAVGGSIIRRDTNGRAKVAAPVNDDEIANKGYVDELDTVIISLISSTEIVDSLDFETKTQSNSYYFTGNLFYDNGTFMTPVKKYPGTDGGAILTSTDGQTWNYSVAMPDSEFQVPHQVRIKKVNNKLYMIDNWADGKAVYVSTNGGSSWTQVSDYGRDSMHDGFCDISFNPSGSVGILTHCVSNSYAKTLNGGTTWTTIPFPHEDTSAYDLIEYGNGVFVVTTYDKIYCSDDGTSFTEVTLPMKPTIVEDNIGFSDLKFINGKFYAVAAGSNLLWKSSNGTSWEVQTITGGKWGNIAMHNDYMMLTPLLDSSPATIAVATDDFTVWKTITVNETMSHIVSNGEVLVGIKETDTRTNETYFSPTGPVVHISYLKQGEDDVTEDVANVVKPYIGGGASSVVGDVIASTALDTEAKVITAKGGTAWTLLSDVGGVYQWERTA